MTTLIGASAPRIDAWDKVLGTADDVTTRTTATGADGIYLFNYFNPRGPLFRELGDAAQLRRKDKLYFATNRDGNPERYLAGARTYQTVPILTPSHPALITLAKPLKINLKVGEAMAGQASGLPKASTWRTTACPTRTCFTSSSISPTSTLSLSMLTILATAVWGEARLPTSSKRSATLPEIGLRTVA